MITSIWCIQIRVQERKQLSCVLRGSWKAWCIYHSHHCQHFIVHHIFGCSFFGNTTNRFWKFRVLENATCNWCAQIRNPKKAHTLFQKFQIFHAKINMGVSIIVVNRVHTVIIASWFASVSSLSRCGSLFVDAIITLLSIKSLYSSKRCGHDGSTSPNTSDVPFPLCCKYTVEEFQFPLQHLLAWFHFQYGREKTWYLSTRAHKECSH